MRALSRLVAAAALIGPWAGCTLVPPPATDPVPAAVPAAAASAASAAASADAAGTAAAATIVRARSRWTATSWDRLPGWASDRVSDWWPAFMRGCERAASPWIALCAEARLTEPGDDAATREWLMRRLQPYRIESPDGGGEGLITGYFEPLVAASRRRAGPYQVPLHAPPADLGTRRPYWTRQQLDTLPAARASLRGREIAYVADPLDALLLQIQGSGRLRLVDGSERTIRLAYAGHNDRTYASVGRWLIDQGELAAGSASWPAIKDWARRHPKRVQDLLWSNPRVVFFREEPLPDPALGPRGAMGVPLTPGRSIAVDPQSLPYGTPVWLDSTEPLSSRPLQRLVMAQDTGSAITGAVRADYFWGWEGDAEVQAGRMKQPLRYWALWPKAAP